MTIMYAGAANVDTGLEWFPMWYGQSGGMNPTWDHQPGSVRRVLVARRKRHRGRGDTGCWHYLRLPDHQYGPNEYLERLDAGALGRSLFATEIEAWVRLRQSMLREIAHYEATLAIARGQLADVDNQLKLARFRRRQR